MGLSFTVSAAIMGKSLEFIEGPLTIYVDGDLRVESVEHGASGKLDLRSYLAMPPIANMHVHSMDYMIAEAGWDLDIDTLVGEPYGLKYILLEKMPTSELRKSIDRFVKLCRSYGIGYLAEFRELGARGLFLDNGLRSPGHYVLAMPEQGKADDEGYLRELAGMAEGLGISSPLYFREEELRSIFRIADSLHIPVFSHISETKETHDEGDVGKLLAYGTPKAVIHGVWLTDEEIETLAERGTHLIICPRSNMWFLSGTPPLKAIYESGIHVSIGTDNGGWLEPDIWRDMEVLFYQLRGSGVNDPSWILKAAFNAEPVGANNVLLEGERISFTLMRYWSTSLEVAKDKAVGIIKRGGRDLVDCVVVDGVPVYVRRGIKAEALCYSLRHNVG